MLAEARQIHHEGVFELAVDFLFHALEIVVLRPFGEFATENFFPVRTPFDLLHAFAGNQRTWTGGRHGPAFACRLQMPIIVVERLIIVVDFRQIWIGKDFSKNAPFRTHLGFDLAVLLADPAAIPLLLVFPLFRETNTGLGFNIVEPGIFNAFAAGPDVFARHRAGVAADALVEIEHHANLRADFHSAASFATGVWGNVALLSSSGPSIQSTLSSLRTTTNSSRFAPTVP